MDGIEAKDPNRVASLVFRSKAGLLMVRRGVENLAGSVMRLPQEAQGEYAFVVAESRAPLWVEQRLAELALQRGKVQNLRCALRRLDGTVVPAGATFSFWQQIGRATRGRGYVEGRQLQEGCLFPAIGGGLCQLSNALYAVALQAGCKIVERHPHTRVIPGSAAEEGRDATVAWNYIDLRFRSTQTLRIEARLTVETLVVRFCADQALAQGVSEPVSLAEAGSHIPTPAFDAPASDARETKRDAALRSVIDVRAHSCHSCGMEACFRHRDLAAKPVTALPEGRTAFLVDEKTPEFARYLEETHRPDDLLGIPLDGARWERPQYAWKQTGYARVATATAETLARAFAARRLGRYGAARLQAQLEGAEALARRFARTLTPEVTHLCVSQALLPFLWRDGHLGGRTFDVLMTRLPLETLHSRLEGAVQAHPEREGGTLTEFRAPQWLVAAEVNALAAANRLITPHAEIAAQFPGRGLRLEWSLPAAKPAKRGTAVAFPGPTAARKGAYELREVARECDLEIVLLGSELEGDAFWQGVRTRRVSRDLGQNWLEGVGVVVQPALIEDRPRLLLAALAAGVPVIATPACGLGDLAGLTTIPYGDTAALKAAIQQSLTPTEEALASHKTQ
ncbi:MAG: hypothetical protein JWL77_3656 [Chthonomonadaceae bacterium]|nr:hypothetical protein [Chthonomonadaceae bacterium]